MDRISKMRANYDHVTLPALQESVQKTSSAALPAVQTAASTDVDRAPSPLEVKESLAAGHSGSSALSESILETEGEGDEESSEIHDVDLASIEESLRSLSARVPSGSQFSEDEAPISLSEFTDLLKVMTLGG